MPASQGPAPLHTVSSSTREERPSTLTRPASCRPSSTGARQAALSAPTNPKNSIMDALPSSRSIMRMATVYPWRAHAGGPVGSARRWQASNAACAPNPMQ